MALGDLLDESKAKSGAARALRHGLQPIERLENFLALGLRNAGPAIADRHPRHPCIGAHGDADRLGAPIARRILKQIAEQAANQPRIALDDRRGGVRGIQLGLIMRAFLRQQVR